MRTIFAKLATCLLTTLLLSSAAPAADEGRTVDFTTVIRDQDDNPITECADQSDRECKKTKEVTLGSVAFKALTNIDRDSAGRVTELSPDESVKRGQLGLSIYKATSAKLTAEEIALIKKQISKIFSPMIVVRTFAILDPNAK